MKAVLHSLLALLALSAFCSFASAEAEDPTRAEARRHFQQGLELAEDGRYHEALREFQSAHQLTDHYAVLYNIGQSYIALGEPLAALLALEQYLEQGQEQLSAERTEQVQVQIAALKAELSELRIRSSSAGGQLFVDGRSLGTLPLPKPLWLLPGQHELELRTADSSTRRTVVLSAGEQVELALEPPGPQVQDPAAKATVPVQAQPAPSAAPPPSSKAQPHQTMRTTGYVTGAVGLGLAAATLSVFLWNLARYERWESEHQALEGQEGAEDYVERQTKNNDLAASIESASQVNVGLAIGSGVLIASGVTLVVLSNRTPARPNPEPTGFLLSYGGVW